MLVNNIEHWLGGMAAVSPRLWQWLGNKEARYYSGKLYERRIDRPIYIAGLARSGTTLILECLAAHEQTVTHRYRDYPFLHVPIWWNWFLDRAGTRNDRAVERFHRDRVYITSQSPESMEEIIWISFFPDCHSPRISHVLTADDSYPVFENYYRDHIRKILFFRRGSRYVAKANYHVTRLQYLHSLFPDAVFVIPFRSPLNHVLSLWRQHRHYCEQEQKDPRVLAYMGRTGHYEFGLNRRPVHNGDTQTVDRIQKLWDEGKDVQGLAILWRSIYQFIADLLAGDMSLRSTVLLVGYDDLCRSPEKMLKRIYDHCELDVTDQVIHSQAQNVFRQRDYDFSFSKKEIEYIEAETRDVYDRILSLTHAETL